MRSGPAIPNLVPEHGDRGPEIGSHSPDEFVARLARADGENRSWREKLGFVCDVLTGTPELDDDTLAYLAIYLRFVGTGEIPSLEEGGHHRPSQHARMASCIFERLAEIRNSENTFIIRQILPWLPSFNAAFMRAEPLTRIRDIAHRNDIPGELKSEIKHTLQNKLHRNAGPEDLITSRQLLDKITAPGNSYPDSFIEEFRRFHRELEEFFNARSLDQELAALASGPAAADSALIRDFLAAKDESATPEQALKVLELLAELRRRFAHARTGQKEALTQQFEIADIRLEEYSFVILSRLAGRFEEAVTWTPALRCLECAVEGLRMSGFDPEECRAVEAELKAAGQEVASGKEEELLRMKAALERCARFAADYSDRILALLSEKVERVGTALAVPEHAVRVFAEGEIRRHPIFQISRITSALIREIRRSIRISPWDTLVPGTASGLLLPVARLDELKESPGHSVVALVEKVEGDEDIPEDVCCLVVAHDIPHLSHLAVRARQHSVPFVVCEDAEAIREFAALAHKKILVTAQAGSDFRWRESPDRETPHAGRPQPSRSRPIRLPEIEFFTQARVLPLREVTFANGGAKAYQARRLEELSCGREADFMVPNGVVIPFGIMESAIRAEGERSRTYFALMHRMDSLPFGELESAARQLQEIVLRSVVPEEVLTGIESAFRPEERVMVRSSSNGEDLETTAGAGLYESVADVSPGDAAGAIKEVWASLWTLRAVISRRNSRIAHESAHMAAYVQQMIDPELSFIIHTRNPINGDRNEIYMELAVGLGETLASGQMRGTPYRLVYNVIEKGVRVLSFAGFRKAVRPRSRGGREETIDYSRTRFTTDSGYRKRLGALIGRIGRHVARSFGRPQDIEGLVRNGVVWLVQARPQQGDDDEF